MPKRISSHSREKKKIGRGLKFNPSIDEWTDACEIYAYDTQIIKHFDICQETFYSFLDKQRYQQEQGNKSAFLETYKSGRNKTRKFALKNILQMAKKGDPSSSIFVAKSFGGLLEAKDIRHIELKKYEVAFKTKQFMTELAKKFELNYEELSEFANKYFSDDKLDDI